MKAMIVLDDIYAQLERDEGVKLFPYRDTSKQKGFEGRPGKLTIGVGRNLDDVGISKYESSILLHNDVTDKLSLLEKSLPWSTLLDPARQGVLVNMAFNMGVGGLMDFRKMLSYLQQSNYQAAAAEMESSAWYNQTGDRAKRLVRQMFTGEWQ